MDKEVIEIIKQLAGSAETALIWYMVIDLVKHIVTCVAAPVLGYMIARGIRGFSIWVDNS